jgi:hypothetical protein
VLIYVLPAAACCSLPHHLLLQNGLNGVNGVSPMSSALNSINGINAAALALQALAAANPALLMSQNPWLAGHMHQMLGGMGAMGPAGAQLGQIPATGPMSMAPVDPAQLAAAQQLGQQLNGTGGLGILLRAGNALVTKPCACLNAYLLTTGLTTWLHVRAAAACSVMFGE